MALTELQKKILLFVKTSSYPCLPALCKEVKLGVDIVQPIVEDLEKIGYIRIDEGENGRQDRVKPHPDRPKLLWDFDFMAD